MVKLVSPSEFTSTTGDDSYPPKCVLLTASLIADILPPAEACEVVRQLFYEQCADILGKGDREELLEDFFARRARSWQERLEAAGLSPHPKAAEPASRSASKNDLPLRSDREEVNHVDRN